jgi:hypothetical protein
MSVSLDRLYNFLNNTVNSNVLIYRWFPHGSKNLLDLNVNSPSCVNWEHWAITPCAIFHDQEPLNFYFYSDQDFISWGAKKLEADQNDKDAMSFWTVVSHPLSFKHCYHSIDLSILFYAHLYDHQILVHSELNSKDVELYVRSGFFPVYYWSHGLIARDWFRYAKVDPILDRKLPVVAKTDFLIYNRAWSGSREYRLFWMQELINNDLIPCCKTTFNPYDGEKHYTNHEFINKDFCLSRFDLESYVELNAADSSASADYVADDYCNTNIEVVLETLFDSSKNHLTEKTLRPIACGHPFILLSTPQSLAYLRRYGFKTFNGLIDESYDQIEDHKDRLLTIIKELKRISAMPESDKKQFLNKLHDIALFNKKHFFSDSFQQQIINEFKENFMQAYDKITSTGPTGKRWERMHNFTLNYLHDSYNKVFLETESGLDEWQISRNLIKDVYLTKTQSQSSPGESLL